MDAGTDGLVAIQAERLTARESGDDAYCPAAELFAIRKVLSSSLAFVPLFLLSARPLSAFLRLLAFPSRAIRGGGKLLLFGVEILLAELSLMTKGQPRPNCHAYRRCERADKFEPLLKVHEPDLSTGG